MSGFSVAKFCLTLCDSMFLLAWNFPGKNSGVSCCFLLQGIFPAQGWNLHLLHCQADSILLRHLGSPNPKYADKKSSEMPSVIMLYDS